MKKIFSVLLALCMSLTMGIAGFADGVGPEVSDEEVIKNGTLVDSEVITSAEGPYLKETYVYQSEPKARGLEQEFSQTTLVQFSSLNDKARGSQNMKRGNVSSTIVWVTSNCPTNWYPNEDPVTGYRLQRVSIQKSSSDIDFVQVNTYNSYARASDSDVVHRINSSSNQIIVEPDTSVYVPDMYGSTLGATLHYELNGHADTLDNYLFD